MQLVASGMPETCALGRTTSYPLGMRNRHPGPAGALEVVVVKVLCEGRLEALPAACKTCDLMSRCRSPSSGRSHECVDPDRVRAPDTHKLSKNTSKHMQNAEGGGSFLFLLLAGKQRSLHVRPRTADD